MQLEKRTVLTLAGVAGLVVAIALSIPIALTPELNRRLTAALAERYGSDVTVERLRVSLLPRLRVAGEGVVFRQDGRRDVPPLVQVESFTATANLAGLLGDPLRLQRVHLAGLQVNIPPGGLDMDDDAGEQEAARPSPGAQAPVDASADDGTSPIVVAVIEAEDAVLRILRRTPDKAPREFVIHELRMNDTGSHVPWAFEARLTNPTPPGEIAARGTFGPLDVDTPSATPLRADYEFRNADLGDFDGIRGELHSTGAFAGVLERIEVDGEASVSDFGLKHAGHRLALETMFHARVDGTNGDTWLEPVHGRFGRTSLRANGGVVEREGEDGVTVELDVVMPEGRLEDVLRLAVKGDPPMTGAIDLTTRLVLPPGEAEVEQRLRLDGSFRIARARFAHGGIQEKVNELSEKARGEGAGGGTAGEVASDFTGRFVMGDGVITFRDLSFAVPGARVDLAGRYVVEGEVLDFRGDVRLDAKPSELTSGVTSFFLRLVDPLVRRDGQTVVPITVGGTVEKPSFRLDVKEALLP